MSELKEIDREKLADLLAKVKAATEPDRELDLAIWNATNTHPSAWHPSFPPQTVVEHNRYGDGASGNPVYTLDAFTASIDAALALVDRLFGVDAHALCYSYDLGWHASAHAEMAFTADLHLAVGNPAEMETVHGQAATLPLAILVALLSALSTLPNTQGKA